MSLADDRIDALRATHPGAVALALCVCLPVRVTPAFVRLARLRLLPQAGTGDEADLWLSDLVGVRSGAGFTFRREVRETLRVALAAQPLLLASLWDQVHQVHARWLTPRLRLEEELTWRLLRDPDDPSIDALWAQVVADLRSGANPEGVARWVTRAMPDLPAGSLRHPHGRLAHHGAHLALGDASVLGDRPQRFLASADFAFATRHLPHQIVRVGWQRGRLLASASADIVHGHDLQLPATRPLWLQVEPSDADPASSAGAASARVLLIDAQVELATLALDGDGPWRLRSLDGAAWELQPALGESRVASPPTPSVPRVELSYPVEVYGTPKRVQLPFVVGVLADLGQPAEGAGPDLRDRRFVAVETASLDTLLAGVRPVVSFRVADPFRDRSEQAVYLEFVRLRDFHPASVAKQLESYGRWQGIERRLAGLADRIETGRIGSDAIIRLLGYHEALEHLRTVESVGEPDPWWDRLMRFLSLQAPQVDEELRLELSAVAQIAAVFGAHSLTEPDLLQGLDHVRERIRQALQGMLASVFQAPAFRRLEATWRGLAQLLARTPTDTLCKVQVLHITRQELVRALSRQADHDDADSVLFKKVHDEPFGQFGGEPFGLLLVDQEFDHRPADVDTLRALGRLGARCHAPVLAAASPSLFQLEAWRDLSSMRDLARLFVTPEYAAWRALRGSDDARFLCLTLPPALAREPWRSDGSGDVPFDEAPGDIDDDRLCWMGSAHLLVANIAQAFRQTHWFARITGAESGGLVRRLPTHGFHPGQAPELSPTGVLISDRMEAALAELGLTALVARRHSDIACFYSAPTLHDAGMGHGQSKAVAPTAGTRLAHVLACSRLMLHLACMLRDRIGSWSPDLVPELQNWADAYVTEEAASASFDEGPDRPFEAVHLAIEPSEDDTQGLQLVATLVPRYQFGEAQPAMRLTRPLGPFLAG